MAMSHRLHPPRVDAGEKVRMGDKMRVERSLIDDLATRDVNQDRVLLSVTAGKKWDTFD
jgi:hypothetical protein